MTSNENDRPGTQRFICPNGKTEFNEPVDEVDIQLYLKQNLFFEFKGKKLIAKPCHCTCDLDQWEIPDSKTENGNKELNECRDRMNMAVEKHIQKQIEVEMIIQRARIEEDIRIKYPKLMNEAASSDLP
jgi:hypothetical protein